MTVPVAKLGHAPGRGIIACGTSGYGLLLRLLASCAHGVPAKVSACRGRITVCRPEQALTITIVQPFFHRGMVHPAGGSEQGNRSGF